MRPARSPAARSQPRQSHRRSLRWLSLRQTPWQMGRAAPCRRSLSLLRPILRSRRPQVRAPARPGSSLPHRLRRSPALAPPRRRRRLLPRRSWARGQARARASRRLLRPQRLVVRQGTSLAPLETQDLPPLGQTPKTARTPQSWPKPPTSKETKIQPPPPAMPKAPSPPSKAQMGKLETTGPTLETKASPHQAAGRAAKRTRQQARRLEKEAEKAAEGKDSPGVADAVYDPKDTTALTNTIGGAGTDVVVTTDTGSNASRESVNALTNALSTSSPAGLPSNTPAPAGDTTEHPVVAGVKGDPAGKHPSAEQQSGCEANAGSSTAAALAAAPSDGPQIASALAPKDSITGEPTSEVTKDDAVDTPSTQPPKDNVADPSSTSPDPLGEVLDVKLEVPEDEDAKVSAGGTATADLDPAPTSSPRANDAVVKDIKPSGEDTPAPQGKAVPLPPADKRKETIESSIREGDAVKAEKALPPSPSGEENQARTVGAADLGRIAGTTIPGQFMDDNPWGLD
ncbi:hypothetical protein BC628DRAFT_151964 [Trametes gibbosa]|nr:hypothetical protein BC628DRAFT_151964 [Trametes gibbosa]